MTPSDPAARPGPKSRSYNPDAFVREFAGLDEKMENKRFCFILGAGASKSSGIALGGELAMNWLAELHQQEGAHGQSLEQWATAQNLDIPDFDLARAADFYTRIFERRFEGRMDDGQFWLEQKFADALPSTGYYLLAQMLGNSRHKVVITTNFDNLAADAVLQLTGSLPRIISDAKIARYLSPQPRVPIIAKVHGDIGFATTMNTARGTARLDEEWRQPLRRILELYVPIVIGWEGNDGSLMDFLSEQMVDEKGQSQLPGGIFWCYRGDKAWQDRLDANPKLAALAKVHAVRFIQIDGFDEWMLLLARSLNKADPLDQLKKQQERRLEKFGSNLRKKLESNNQANSAAAREPHGTSATSIPDLLRTYDDKNLRGLADQVLSAALDESPKSTEETELDFQIAVEQHPNDAETLGHYAQFLENERADFDKAEAFYEKAIAAAPSHMANLGNFALFLQNRRQDYARSEKLYREAVAGPAPEAHTLSNFAEFALLHGSEPLAKSCLAAAARKGILRRDEYSSQAAAILWMSAAIAERTSPPDGDILGALKAIVCRPSYSSKFQYDKLIPWIDAHAPAKEAGEFWMAVARVCEGTEKAETLSRFDRWIGAKAVPVERGLKAVAEIAGPSF